MKNNCFTPQSEPPTSKLCFSIVLMHFGEIHRELFFLDIKVAISESSTVIFRKKISYNVRKVANPEENLNLFNQFFFVKQVKGNK